MTTTKTSQFRSLLQTITCERYSTKEAMWVKCCEARDRGEVDQAQLAQLQAALR
jgi:hypothetical protein